MFVFIHTKIPLPTSELNVTCGSCNFLRLYSTEVVFVVEYTVEGRLCVDKDGAGKGVELSVPTLVNRLTFDTDPFLDVFLLNISSVN